MKRNVSILVDSLTGGGAEKAAGLLSVYLTQWYNVYIFIRNNRVTYNYGGTLVVIDDICFCDAVKTQKKRFKIDYSISVGNEMNYVNIRTRINDKILVWHHNTTEIRNKDLPLLQKYYPYADSIIACSYGMGELLEKNGNIDGNKINVIYNLLGKDDLSKDNELPDEVITFLEGEKYVLNVGRLTWEKNQKSLIRQFTEYHRKYGNSLKLLIVGDGILEEELKREIYEREMENYIRIIPFGENIGVLYKNALFFLLSSVTEGFSNVLLEAMNYGLPIISTDCLAGPRELLNDEMDYCGTVTDYRIVKRGILVGQDVYNQNNNTSYLADAINMLITNSGLMEKLSIESKKFINNYSNINIAEAWRVIIEAPYIYSEELEKEDQDYNKLIRGAIVIIYGCGTYGRKVLKSVKPYAREVYFATTDNPCSMMVDGVTVCKIEDFECYKKEAIILLGSIKEKNVYDMKMKAETIGFEKILFGKI